MKYKNIIDYINNQHQQMVKLIYQKEVNNLNNVQIEYDNSKISELYMHKLLFFIYGGFYKKFHKELFNANFEAWNYGPIEINYHLFVKDSTELGELKQNFNFNNELNQQEKDYLDELISFLLKRSLYTLVELGHYTDCWKNKAHKDLKNLKITNQDFLDSSFFESFVDLRFLNV